MTEVPELTELLADSPTIWGKWGPDDEVARAVRLGDGPAAERAMRAIIDEAAAALRAEQER